MDDSSKKQKLFLVITKSNFGGAQKYVFDLASHFKDQYDLTVIFGGEGLLSKKLAEAHIHTISLPLLGKDIHLGNDIQTFLALRQLIADEKPDIIHLNSSKIGLLGALAARISWHGPRIIFTAHAWAFNEDRPFWARFFIYLFHLLTVLLSDATIAVSRAVKEQLASLPFIRKKIHVVHLGIDDLPFYGREESRKTLNIEPNAFCIGTIAELHPIKGLSDSIYAVQQIKSNPPYIILGEGRDRERLEHLIREESDCDIRLPGYTKDASLLLKAFDLFILPSHSEALGYVLLEAGLAGVPIIATNVGGIPEIITHSSTGILVEPGNPGALLREILAFRETKEDAQPKTTQLRMEILEHFSLQNMCTATRFVYQGKQ